MPHLIEKSLAHATIGRESMHKLTPRLLDHRRVCPCVEGGPPRPRRRWTI